MQTATARRELNGLEKQLEAINERRANVDIDADITAAQAHIRELESTLDEVNRRKAEPKVLADTAQAKQRLAEVQQLLGKLSGTSANPEVDLQVARATQEALRIQAELDRLSAMRPSPEVDADIAALSAKLGVARQALSAIDAARATPDVTADTSTAQARLVEVQLLLARLSGETATPEVELQVARAQQEVLRIESELGRLGAMRPSPEVDVEISALSAKLAVARQQLTEIDAARATPEVTADTSSARAQLSQLELTLRQLDVANASPQVQVQAAQAQQECLRIRAELDRLGAMAPSPQVDADIASATAKLALVNQQLRSLGDKTVHVNASGNAGIILSGIAAALGAIMAVAPAAAAALAGVAGAAGAVGQGVAAGLAGFSGIGDALKALEQDEKSAATSSASSSNTRAAAAKQVESAQRQLASAQQNVARAAITGAQQVADAERSLAQASVAASRARIQADQQVAAARRAVSDAVESANARVASAERSLESAQRSRQYAQERLTDAVRDATRAQRDLNLQVSGAALSEERATLSLAQARERLAKSTSADPLERADLALSVREAEQNLKEVQNRYGDLKSDQADWARGGVAGSRQVRDATRGVEDAQRGVQDAARGVTEAQVSGARQVADAQQALAVAQQQAAWSVQDAQRGVADAQLAVGRASQQAAWAQQDAAQQVADAQRALADAYTQGGEAAASGSKQAEYALGKLTPAGRSLVTFLDKEWAPSWKRVTDSVADAMLPKVETALRNLLALEPVVKAGLTETGNVLGDLAVKGSQLATSAPFQANFASIMASNNRALRSYGDAGLNLFGAFTDLYAAAGPVTEEFARNAAAASDAFESWVIGARASGDLDRWLQKAADTLEYLGGWLVDVGGDIVGFASSLAPLGGVVLEVVRGITDWVSWLAQLNPALTSTVAGAALAATAASKLGTAMSGLAIAQNAGGLRGFANVLTTVLNPAALYSSSALTGLRAGFDKVGGSTSGFVQNVSGSGRAATAMAGGARMAGTAISGLAAGFPLLATAAIATTVAVDASTASVSEAAEAMMKGGTAAAAMRQQIGLQNGTLGENSDWIDRVFSGWSEYIGYQTGWWATMRGTTEEIDKQRAGMTALERAQSFATEAQGNYESAVRQFGANSPQAVAAQEQLALKTGDVAREQDNARRATMNATQALQDQQNKILASIDSRLALRQSTQQVADAQKAYADAVRNSGAGSDEANAAQLRLEQAQTSQAAAARRAAEEEAKRKGVVDASALANQAYGQSIGDMVAKSQGQLTPALTEMVQSLDGAGLAAAGAKVHIDGAGNAIATFPNGKTVTLTAQTSPEFFAQVKLAQDTVNMTRGTIGVDADTGPGVQQVGNFKLATDQTRGVVTVDGNISPADQQRLGIQAKTDGTTGTMWINGNPVQCDGALNGARFRVDETTGVMSIDANPADADRKNAATHDAANNPETFNVDANTANADSWIKRWWNGVMDWFRGNPVSPQIEPGRPVPGIGQGRAQGGLIEGYATGGAVPGLTHKQVIRGFAAGASGSSRIASSDTVPAMLTPGEFVIRKRAVDAIGLPTLNALNGMALGGVVGFAAGGSAKPKAASGAGAASVTVPTGDAGAASGAAGATDALTGSMTEAGAAAGMLAPQLAAVTAEQQAMTTGGVTPLAGAITGTLAPAFGVYATQVGVTAPLANTALQGAQTATQLSTNQTAMNTAVNAQQMTAATTGMSVMSQAQHAGLRAGQFATQVSTDTTAVNAGVNNAAMAASTTGMSVQAQAQHAGLRFGHALTQQSNVATAQNTAANDAAMAGSMTGMSLAGQAQHAGLRAGHGLTQQSNVALAQNTAGNNVNMEQTTGNMSGTNQGHLAGLRGAQGVTTQATVGFADSWRDQLGRTVPDSANPLRHVITVPIRGIVDAWNTIDGQFALGKHVPPPAANFATGGVMPGYTPGRDVMTAAVSGGEAIMRPEWTRVVGSQYIDQANAAARSGGLRGVQSFLGGPTTSNPRAEGNAKQKLMRRFPLDDAAHRIRSRWAGGFAYGGVAPHVAAAGDAVVRALGPMPGGIGGRAGRGNVSDHPSGFALDFMTMANMPLGDRVAGMLTAQAEPLAVKYLIWKQAINQGKGWNPMENRGSPTANHMDHVHASFEGGPLGGKWGDGPAGGSMFDFGSLIRDAFKFVFDLVAGVPKIFGPSDQVARGAGIPKVGADLAIDKLISTLGAMFASSGGGGNAAAFRPQISAALGMLGLPQAWAANTERRMNQESGGNPQAVNRWDSNWARGTPSVGLMQVIGPTYRSNADPRHNVGPYLYGTSIDPLSNILASMRYTMGRYGSLPRGYDKAGGYDNGGLLQPGRTLVENRTGFPERVLTNVETRSYDTLTRLVGKNGVRVELGDFTPQGSGPAVQIGTVMTAPGETATGMARAMTREIKRTRRGGVYSGVQ